MFRGLFNGRCLATPLAPAMVRIILICRLRPRDAHSPASSRFTWPTLAIEQCQKGTANVPGNPNCTAIYGSGTLSSVLGLNNFDSIAFLIQYNQGYPMSIPVCHSACRNSALKVAPKSWTNDSAKIVRSRTSQLHGLSSTRLPKTAEATRSRQSTAITRNVSRLAKLDAWVVIRHHCAIIPHLQLTET